MQAEGLLELIAEISVAFACFSGLLGAFRRNSPTYRDQQNEMRILIDYALLLLARALAPLILWNIGIDEPTAWRVASAISVGSVVVYYARRGPQFFSDARNDESRLTYSTVNTFVLFDLLAAAALTINAAGWSPWTPNVIYLVDLCYLLCGTSLSFVRFASHVWTGAAAEQGTSGQGVAK